MPPPAGAFTTSKYFRTFINFTNFAKSVDMPLPEKFIWLMVEKDFSPTMWMQDEVYSMYLEFLDHKTSPLEQVNISVDTLLTHAERLHVDVSNIFDQLQAPDIIQLLRTRKLSPWLLLLSKKFKLMFANNTTSEQRIILETLIQPERWITKLKDHTKEVETIKILVQELGI